MTANGPRAPNRVVGAQFIFQRLVNDTVWADCRTWGALAVDGVWMTPSQ